MNREELNFDEIINANMTVTDDKLRDAIHAVMVDLMFEVRDNCAEICKEKMYKEVASHFDEGYNQGIKTCVAVLIGEEE